MKTLSLDKTQPWWRGTYVDNDTFTAQLHNEARAQRGMRLEFHASPRYTGIFVWAMGECTGVIYNEGIMGA